MSRNVGEWIVPVNKRDGIRYSYRGGQVRFQKLKQAFDRFPDQKLERRVLDSPLGPIYSAMEHFHYSSAVVYNMLVRSVVSDVEDQLLFRFADTICRLGRAEFAMISGLSFLSTEVDRRSIEEIGPSSLIAHRDPATGVHSDGPFHNVHDIKIKQIEAKLVDENNAENVYKLGLVYLIDAVMYGRSATKPVSSFVFKLVDDTEQFLAYPWGTYFWDVSLFEWKKRIEFLTNTPGKKGKKKNTKKKNTEGKPENEGIPSDDIFGLVPALVAWGCESIPTDAVRNIAVRDNDQLPRISRWRPLSSRIYLKDMTDAFKAMTSDVTRHLVPSDDEVTMLLSNGLTDDEITTAITTYPVPTDAPSRPAPTTTFPQPTNVSDPLRSAPAHDDVSRHAATASQAARAQSSDDGNESVYLRAVSEMRAEMKQLIGDATVVVRDTREHIGRQVALLREEVTGLKNENRKDIRELGDGVTQQIAQLQGSIGSKAHSIDPPPPPPSSGHAGSARKTHNYGQDEHQHHPHQQERTDTNTFHNEQGHAEQLHEPTTSVDLMLNECRNTQFYVPIDSYIRVDFYNNLHDSWNATTAAPVKEATSSAVEGEVKDDERPAREGDKGDAPTVALVNEATSSAVVGEVRQAVREGDVPTAVPVKEATSSAAVGDVRRGKRHVREGDKGDVPPPKRKTTTKKTKPKSKTKITKGKVADLTANYKAVMDYI